MKASKMYDQSLLAHQRLPPEHELPTRLLNALRGSGLIEKEEGKQPRLKTNELREAILNGTIWEIRNVGETYVKLLCEWLEQQDIINPWPEG